MERMSDHLLANFNDLGRAARVLLIDSPFTLALIISLILSLVLAGDSG
jgi:hypothetical protein